MRSAQSDMFVKVIFSVIMLAITLTIVGYAVWPFFSNFLDPCWANFQSHANMILPRSWQQGEFKEVSIMVDSNCLDALVFQTKKNPIPTFCELPYEKEERDKIEGYILGYPNPKISESLKEKTVNWVTGKRKEFCIPVYKKMQISKKIINRPGNYTIIIEKAADSYSISWKPTKETIAKLNKMNEILQKAETRANEKYGLEGELITEFDDIGSCLKLLNENKDNYLLLAVTDPESNWYNLGGFKNIYLIKSGGGDEYGIYVEDSGDGEFEIIDCSIAGFDWKLRDWERVTLNKILMDGNCKSDATPVSWINFEDIEKYNNINSQCS